MHWERNASGTIRSGENLQQSRKIVSTTTSDTRLHLSGVSPSGAPSSNEASGSFSFSRAIKTGDGLAFRMYSHNASAALSIYFTDGTTLPSSGSTCGVDQNGECLSEETVSNSWVNRIVNLGAIANGKTISYMILHNGPTAPAGQFDLMIADMSIISLDGTVSPLIGDLPSVACTASGTTGMTGVTCVPETVTSSTDFAGVPETNRYYLSDHLGTAQLELTSGGWPIWRGQFSPFGQEIDTLATSNNYKFTGQERDTESGNDYFVARYYSSSIGRFTSPDPSGLYSADPTNPQSLNLYTYVLNNPLLYIDPTGLDCTGTEATGNQTFALDPSDEQQASIPNCAQDDSVSPEAIAANKVKVIPKPNDPNYSDNVNAFRMDDLYLFPPGSLNGRIPRKPPFVPLHMVSATISSGQYQCETGVMLNSAMHGAGAAAKELKGDAKKLAGNFIKTTVPFMGTLAAEGTRAIGLSAQVVEGIGTAASGAGVIVGTAASAYVAYSGGKAAVAYYSDNIRSCAAIP